VNASLDEIRSGFRRQLMKYHPDRAEAEGYDLDAASARTRQIYDAYAVLRDPSKRATYDASRKSSKFW
jgi:DnaJ-class molecular chaperone